MEQSVILDVLSSKADAKTKMIVLAVLAGVDTKIRLRNECHITTPESERYALSRAGILFGSDPKIGVTLLIREGSQVAKLKESMSGKQEAVDPGPGANPDKGGGAGGSPRARNGKTKQAVGTDSPDPE